MTLPVMLAISVTLPSQSPLSLLFPSSNEVVKETKVQKKFLLIP